MCKGGISSSIEREQKRYEQVLCSLGKAAWEAGKLQNDGGTAERNGR